MSAAPINDGGPAFPTDSESQVGYSAYHYEGMSLRDWYAGMALQGMLARPNSSPIGYTKSKEGYSKAAFELADAMLKARAAS